MLNVVCIKWGDKYSPQYVNHLARGVRRHLTLPHRFVCLTDDPRGISRDVETKPLTDDLPGWWNKIALFKRELDDLRGTLLYIDLDMVIVGSLDHVVQHPGRFLAVPAAAIENEFAAALLRFEIGGCARLWDLFEPRAQEVMREIYGDQNWINACAGKRHVGEYSSKVRRLWPQVTPQQCSIDALPRAWFPDFKNDLQQACQGLHSDAKVIVFHGRPMVHEVDWVAPLWRGEKSLADYGVLDSPAAAPRTS